MRSSSQVTAGTYFVFVLEGQFEHKKQKQKKKKQETRKNVTTFFLIIPIFYFVSSGKVMYLVWP